MADKQPELNREVFDTIYGVTKGNAGFPNYIINDASFFDDPRIAFETLSFTGCRFTKDFRLTNAFKTRKLSFKDCEFEGDLSFEMMTMRGGQADDFVSDPNLYISNCNIKGILGLVLKMEGSILVEKSECGGLAAVIEETDNLYIGDCRTNLMHITAARVKNQLWLSTNTISNLIIDKVECGNLLLSGNTVTDLQFHEHIRYNREDGKIRLVGNTIEGCNIRISPHFKGTTVIKENTFRNGVITSQGTDDGKAADPNSQNRPVQKHRAERPGPALMHNATVEVTDNTIQNVLTIENTMPIKLLAISVAPFNKGMLHIKRAKVETLSLTGTVQGSTLNLDLLYTVNVKISKLMNYGNVLLSNYTPLVPATFSVANSNLGPAELSDMAFDKNISVEIRNSSLSDLRFSAVTWFSEEKLNLLTRPDNSPNNLRRNDQLHDIFRQLRRAAEKASDKSLTAQFRALEHKYQLRILRATEPFYHQERMLLTLNLSNRFGTDWVRPIWLAILVSAVGYLAIMGSLCAGPDLGMGYLESVWKYSFAIPQLLNPAHSLAAVFDYRQYPELAGKLTILPYFIDLLVRVMVSYLLVQTVIAFRKQSN